ncbi:hypothetical protein ACW4FQ_28855, partial [Escherichia coli]
MMHGDSRVMVVVCLETASLPAPCLSTSTSPRSREEPFFVSKRFLKKTFSNTLGRTKFEKKAMTHRTQTAN